MIGDASIWTKQESKKISRAIFPFSVCTPSINSQVYVFSQCRAFERPLNAWGGFLGVSGGVGGVATASLYGVHHGDELC